MFAFTDEQKMAQKMMRKWAEAELAPNVPAMEKGELLPYDLMRKLVNTFGLPHMVKSYFKSLEEKEKEGAPKKKKALSALGGDPAWAAIFSIEMSRICPGFMLAFGASAGLCGGAIMARGTLEQKKRWALPVLTFEKIGCWGMTEPDAGSDAFGGMRATAHEDGDSYILNGQKTFITNAPFADIFVVYAKVVREVGEDGRSRPIHAFVVERGTEGLDTPPPMRKMGMHTSPTGEIFLEDCRVPAANLLGGDRKKATGRKGGTDVFHGERTGVVPMALGIIERCLDDSVQYAKDRKTWGKPIGEYQLIQDKLAKMFVARENVRNLMFKQMYCERKGLPLSMAEACACKLYSARVATDVALEAVQIMAGNGYMEEYHVEMLMRDAKLLQIGGGTDEMQITRIARQLLTD